MKSITKYISIAALTAGTIFGVTSCASEDPFESAGEGSLHLSTTIQGETVTRGDIDQETMSSLREKAVVYIERSNSETGNHDVVRKYKGLDNIPASITLNKGNTYVAEAWTGDSVSASFLAKFYRGKTEDFRIEDETSVHLQVNIANVLVSFAPETFNLGLNDLKMTVGHSRGELEFSDSAEGESTLHSTGYFMMPSTDKDLTFKVSATTASGESIVREGTIENVQRAHEYQVRLVANESPSMGGALIRIEIEDIPVIEDTIDIFGRPNITGVGYDISEQVISTPGNFNDQVVYICGYKGLTTVSLGGSDSPELISGKTQVNLTNLAEGEADMLNAAGISWSHGLKQDASSGVQIEEYYVTFKKSYLDALPSSSIEYKIALTATDKSGKPSTATLRIANSESAIEVAAPVGTAEAPDPETSPMSILAHQVTLTGYVYDSSATNYGIKYRKSGDSQWTEVLASSASQIKVRKKLQGLTRSQIAMKSESVTFSVTLMNLEAGTTYEYKTYCDGYDDAAVSTVTTESVFAIPNASFEEWDTYKASTLLGTKNVKFPGTGERTFWDSGNEGAATANATLTSESTDMVHSGTYSAKLQCKSVMSMMAAGNIFVGSYVKTDGTNGVLSFGREYNQSHPTKLTVWANYRPGNVDKTSSSVSALVSGEPDHGQIYIALTTAPIDIRTKSSDQHLFSKDYDEVLAYGEVTWTGDFGADGELQKVEIPITYNERAQNNRPMYIIIVASASKYGDYFAGSTSSVMYLDDFELVYE